MSAHNQNIQSVRHSGAAHRRAHLWFELKLALAVLALFTVFKLWFEHTQLGHWLEVQTHVWLQSQLRPFDATHFPIVVVDIADLKPVAYEVVEHDATNEISFTPRDKLRVLLENIAVARPAAIGVDVDMSIEPELHPGAKFENESRLLFESALGLRHTNVAVYFGVKRNDGRAPGTWLGDERFVPLAASLARPKGLIRELPSEFAFPGHSQHLKTLSRALADHAGLCDVEAAAPPPRWMRLFTRQIFSEEPVKDAPDFRMQQYLVDYSPLELLISNRVAAATVIGISTNDAAGFAKLGGWFHNKLILLGDADPLGGMDSANVPARAEPVPGVYLHACGAYTLGRAPLYRLEIWFGMTLAVLCFLAAVMMVHWVCLKYAGRYQVTGTPLTVVLSLALLGLFLLAAVLLARWLHVLWLEVIALCVVLVMHCFVEILLRTVKWEHFRESAVKPFIVASSSKKKRG